MATPLEIAEAEARAAWCEPHRHYHDERHLDACLSALDGVALAERERRVLRWALLWHDAVYDPAAPDNEERSAAWARASLRAAGVAEDEAAEVARLILLTKGHRVEGGDRLGALMVSIDLAVLGAEEEAYDAYAADIRREYAHVPEEAWRKGRGAVLASLLAADPLYPEPGARAALEAQARANISRELAALSPTG